ncbi:MAG: hypothetical protein JO197_02205 [Acidobacteria bacterium]|nr:hypothetical protein [Acidobacteriota bacterium]
MMESIFTLPGCTFSEPDDQWCPPLAENLGDSVGEPRPGHFGTPERFFQWLKTIWAFPVDADASFPPTDFTRNCLLMDSFATVCGALHGSLYFRLIFAFFPNLSGPHFDFAANERIFITNWAFETTNGKQDILVPAIDIFGFRKGYVNYRLATFDVPTLVRALLIAYGGTLHPNFEGNMEERIKRWATDFEFAEREYAAVKAMGPVAASAVPARIVS